MRYNLFLVKDHCKNIHFEEKITDLPYVALCTSTMVLKETPDSLNSNILYIIKAEDISFRPIQSGIPSVIVLGKPPKNWIDSDINILYTEDPITVNGLMNEIYSMIIDLAEWRDSMQEVIDLNLPAIELAKRSEKFIRNPIVAQGIDYNYIFAYAPDPKDYVQHDNKYSGFSEEQLQIWATRINDYTGKTIPQDLINILIRDPEYVKLAENTYPALYYHSTASTGAMTKALTYNVRISGAIIAVLNINELYGEIKNADYYYIMMVASYLRKLLRSKTIQPRNVNLDAELSELMNTLLSRNLLPEKHIENILKKNDWEIDNRYVCVCLELQRFDDPNYQNAVLVSSLYDDKKTYIYTFYDKYLVIIYNLSQMNVSFSNFISNMTPILKNTDTYAGISLAFQDFKNLYYYYDQATFALSLISDASSPEQRIVNYHDYIADYAVQNCLKQNINLSYVPLGLLRLMAYDEKKNSNFTHMQIGRAHV